MRQYPSQSFVFLALCRWTLKETRQLGIPIRRCVCAKITDSGSGSDRRTDPDSLDVYELADAEL